MNEIKDHVITAFHEVTREGVLCNELMRGVRFNIHDVLLHTDAIHRGYGQVGLAAKRCMFASVLTASPRILEPMYLVEIQCPESSVGSVYSTITKKRGLVFKDDVKIGTPLHYLKAYLPVNESFNFNSDLRKATSGTAFPQLIFDHWELMDNNPLDKNTKSYEIVKITRKRKGLPEDIPPLDRFLDKL